MWRRNKARKFHPDVNKEPGAEQTFKDISNAYEVLNDDQKRGIYDRSVAHLGLWARGLHCCGPHRSRALKALKQAQQLH